MLGVAVAAVVHERPANRRRPRGREDVERPGEVESAVGQHHRRPGLVAPLVDAMARPHESTERRRSGRRAPDSSRAGGYRPDRALRLR